MQREIRKVAVLGAGVMGSGIAAHLANAGVSVVMLDIVPPELGPDDEKKGLTKDSPAFRNKLALQGLEGLKKSKPAMVYSKRRLDLIEVGNFEDDWDTIADCDWIVEVVVERLDIKQKVFGRVEEVRKQGAIVSSNTSGLSIKGMTEGRSDDFKQHFLVTHFFNPVRYMRLLELVAGEDTLPEVLDFVADFGRYRLGKGIVYGKDTPNFVGNRIGVFGIMDTVHTMMEMDYQPDEVDAITGPAMCHPSSASFGTVDLVGLDVMVHVVNTLKDGCPDDEMRHLFEVPDFIQGMLDKKLLGRKAKAGFFKRVKNDEGKYDYYTYDWKTEEYRPKSKPDYSSLKRTKKINDPAERIKLLVNQDDRAGVFAWRLTRDTVVYAANRMGEIADTIVDVDNALRWGFNWELGPFEKWDAIGVAESIERMKAEGVEPPQWVLDMLDSGCETFYRESETTIGRDYYDIETKSYTPVPRPETFVLLSDLKKDEQAEVFANEGASLVDLGDGIACIEFHSALQPKLNPIDDKIMEVMQKGVEIAERDFRGLVVHHQGEQFCAGANLLMILEAAQNQQWNAISEMVRVFQGMTTGLRDCSVPTVVAPFGFTFGGGCEITMGGDEVCALAESYIGLVEVGVGLIPAGGGCYFMLERVLEGIDKPVLSNLPFLQMAFENIGMAKVATSAEEAKERKYLRPSNRIEMNPDQQLWTAKRMAMAMADIGYVTPQPKKLHLPGREGLATIKMMLHNMKLTHWVSSHDEKIGQHLGNVLCGGDTTINDPVDRATILDLEREAFLSLCGEPKTQDRIQYMLLNNKPLRN